MFNEIDADAFFMEYDTARAGDFEPLDTPKGQNCCPRNCLLQIPKFESPDDLCTRIDEATKFIDLEQLALSPQCGFASTVAGNPVTFDDEKRKLARIVEVSERVWG